MPGDGEDAIGLDQKPEGKGSLIGSLQDLLGTDKVSGQSFSSHYRSLGILPLASFR